MGKLASGGGGQLRYWGDLSLARRVALVVGRRRACERAAPARHGLQTRASAAAALLAV